MLPAIKRRTRTSWTVTTHLQPTQNGDFSGLLHYIGTALFRLKRAFVHFLWRAEPVRNDTPWRRRKSCDKHQTGRIKRHPKRWDGLAGGDQYKTSPKATLRGLLGSESWRATRPIPTIAELEDTKRHGSQTVAKTQAYPGAEPLNRRRIQASSRRFNTLTRRSSLKLCRSMAHNATISIRARLPTIPHLQLAFSLRQPRTPGCSDHLDRHRRTTNTIITLKLTRPSGIQAYIRQRQQTNRLPLRLGQA